MLIVVCNGLGKCIRNVDFYLEGPSLLAVHMFTCETMVSEKYEILQINWVEHYEITSWGHVQTQTDIGACIPFYKPSHARVAQWPTLKSEQTSVWLGLLKMDKSLTSVSGAQVAYAGRPLDIWQADRALSPTYSDIREYASQTSNCLEVRELLTARYRGQLSLPYDLCCAQLPKVILLALSFLKRKKIYSPHRGYEPKKKE